MGRMARGAGTGGARAEQGGSRDVSSMRAWYEAPTAWGTTARMALGQTEYHGAPVNQAYKVAVISNK